MMYRKLLGDRKRSRIERLVLPLMAQGRVPYLFGGQQLGGLDGGSRGDLDHLVDEV